MDIQRFQQRLQEVKLQLDNGEIDEIPLDARPNMPAFDFHQESYVVVSYSRKDFEKVYMLLAYLSENGYRFWYDNGMKGTEKWIKEYKDKFKNPNCLGTITFFSDNYISDSIKEELSVIYNQDGYIKRNVMISLVPLQSLDANKTLINAISKERITIANANAVQPILTKLLESEKQKTIHRLINESDIPFLAEKIGGAFQIRGTGKMVNELDNHQKPSDEDPEAFEICDGVLVRYSGRSQSVKVPEGVTGIRGKAFAGCKTMTEVWLPDSVTELDICAFRSCGALTRVRLSENLTEIPICAFDGCISLESITIPDGVKEIGSDSFEICRSLESVTIPEGVIRIGSGAFNGCDSLESVALPTTLRELGMMVFAGCERLYFLTYSGTKEQWEAIHKEQEWYKRSAILAVKCQDGTIILR